MGIICKAGAIFRKYQSIISCCSRSRMDYYQRRLLHKLVAAEYFHLALTLSMIMENIEIRIESQIGDRKGTFGAGAGLDSMRDIGGQVLKKHVRRSNNYNATTK